MTDFSKLPLQINMIPSTSTMKNLRLIFKKSQWDKIRKDAYKRADYKCVICGGIGKRHPVEAHEEWDFNANTGVQTLIEVNALCPSCHLCKHAGRAYKMGQGREVLRHLCKVNNLTWEQAQEQATQATIKCALLSKLNWKVDVATWLTKNGYEFDEFNTALLDLLNKAELKALTN